MKKRGLLILFSILAVALIIYHLTVYFTVPKVEPFNLTDYQLYIEEFPTDKNIGDATDLKDVIEKSEDIWIEIYGKSIKWERPYKAYYDSNSDVWLIQGSLPSFMAGGVAYILIEKSTGNVLAVWHDK